MHDHLKTLFLHLSFRLMIHSYPSVNTTGLNGLRGRWWRLDIAAPGNGLIL